MSEAQPEVTPEVTPVTPPATPPVTETTWRDQHLAGSPELVGHPDLQVHGSVEALARNHIERGELIGRKGAILPKEGDEADLQRFYGDVGRPETAEGYNFEKLQPPEGLPWDDGLALGMIASAHRNGLTQAQLDGVMGDYISAQDGLFRGASAAGEQITAETTAGLQKEYGEAYPEKMQAAREAIKSIFGDKAEQMEHLPLAGGGMLGSHPDFVRFLVAAGEDGGEHGFLGGGQRPRLSKTPDEADQEIKELEAHPGLWDENHPEQKVLFAKWTALHKFKHPEPQQSAG